MKLCGVQLLDVNLFLKWLKNFKNLVVDYAKKGE